MKKIIFLVVAGLLFNSFAFADTSWRCKGLDIKPGVTSAEVMVECGTPILKEELGTFGRTGEKYERWTYGPEAGFYYMLYFVAGTLEKLEGKKQ